MIEAVQGLQVKCSKVFCPVYTLYSLGEKAGETRSSQAPASDCPLLLFPGIHRASTPLSLFPPSPRVLPTLLMHLPSQATVDTSPHRFVSPASAVPTSLPGRRSQPLPGGQPVSPRLRRTPTIGSQPPSRMGLAPMATPMMASAIA
jgi:hypothetical protein